MLAATRWLAVAMPWAAAARRPPWLWPPQAPLAAAIHRLWRPDGSQGRGSHGFRPPHGLRRSHGLHSCQGLRPPHSLRRPRGCGDGHPHMACGDVTGGGGCGGPMGCNEPKPRPLLRRAARGLARRRDTPEPSPQTTDPGRTSHGALRGRAPVAHCRPAVIAGPGVWEVSVGPGTTPDRPHSK